MSDVLKSVVLRALLFARDVAHLFYSFEEVSILAYHSISDAEVDTAVSAKDFELQLKHLQRRGRVFKSLQHVVEWHDGMRSLPEKVVALTFDDGYADFETTVLPILEEFSAPATLFVVGDRDASRARLHNTIPLLDGEALARLRAHPLLTLGYHSRSHKNVAPLPKEEMLEECASPLPAEFFAYPGGTHSPEARELLKSLDYIAAFSLKPELVKRTSDLFVMPRNIVFRDMPLWQLDARTTKAIDWYRAVRKFFKPYGPRK